jgi:hypothetical protein
MLTSFSHSELVQEPKTNSWVLENLKAEAKKAKLIGAEIISAVILTDHEWTNENVRRSYRTRLLGSANQDRVCSHQLRNCRGERSGLCSSNRLTRHTDCLVFIEFR